MKIYLIKIYSFGLNEEDFNKTKNALSLPSVKSLRAVWMMITNITLNVIWSYQLRTFIRQAIRW